MAGFLFLFLLSLSTCKDIFVVKIVCLHFKIDFSLEAVGNVLSGCYILFMVIIFTDYIIFYWWINQP